MKKKLVVTVLLFAASAPLPAVQVKPLPSQWFCQAQAQAAFDHCLISGGSSLACTSTAVNVYTKCILN